jgi:TRAP-type mannitol/chloroaromatic compound transport system permease small subunit
MIRKLEALINFILDSTGRIASLLLIALVGIIAYNVINRYAFNRSSIALEELSWHLYSSIFLLGIAYAVRTGSHVRVDLIYDSRSPKTQAIIDIVGTLVLMLPFAAIMFQFGFVFAKESYSFGTHANTFPGLVNQFLTTGIGERSQDPGGLNNRFVIKSVIPLAFALTFLSGVSVLIAKVRVLKQLGGTKGPAPTGDAQ